MRSKRRTGGWAAHTAHPPRVLLALNRPALERGLQHRADCHVTATVRDASELQAHLRPGVAEVLVLARGFLETSHGAPLPSLLGPWQVLWVGSGIPAGSGTPAVVADWLSCLLLVWRLKGLG